MMLPYRYKMFSNNVTIILILCVTIFLILRVQSAKILVVVPTPSISHQVVFRPLIHELINRDHKVTVITTDSIYQEGKATKNLTVIDLHDLSYTLWDEMLSNLGKSDPSDAYYIMKTVFRDLSKIFIEQLKNKSLQKLITDKTVEFDLLIVEAWVTPALILSHIFEAPVIQMSSLGSVIPGNMDIIGAATHPFLYPMIFHKRFYNLSIWEKVIGLYNHVAFNRMIENQEFNDNMALQRIFGVDTPPLSQLKNNVHMLFLNVHSMWLHNQPVPPNVIFIWGIHKRTEKSLPKELQSYLDSSRNGVIYVSFGSNVRSSSISWEKWEILLKVFSRLPFDILWKWDLDELPGRTENIKISKWFPQADVLRHPNLKLFITQGGLQSTEEAINAAVPVIGIPVYGDQAYNTEKYEYFKIGKNLDLNSLTVEKLQTAISNIFMDYESYRQNIVHLRTQMYDQPKPPLENAIWWIEYVLRHGGAKHLRTPAANMSWAEYYELKLVFVILSGLVLLATLLILTVYFCYKSISRASSTFRLSKSKVL